MRGDLSAGRDPRRTERRGQDDRLAPRAFEKRIAQWRVAGYEVGLIFMSLLAAEVSIERVRTRIAKGGHDVPDDLIRRRYEEGLRNFFQKYRDLVDRWHLFDNRDAEPSLIAKANSTEGIRIVDLEKWTTLEDEVRAVSIKSTETFAEFMTSPDGVEQAVKQAVREALIEHHEAGQPVPTWRDGKVVWVHVNERGEYADEA